VRLDLLVDARVAVPEDSLCVDQVHAGGLQQGRGVCLKSCRRMGRTCAFGQSFRPSLGSGAAQRPRRTARSHSAPAADVLEYPAPL
jgi:hypothetical protein